MSKNKRKRFCNKCYTSHYALTGSKCEFSPLDNYGQQGYEEEDDWPAGWADPEMPWDTFGTSQLEKGRLIPPPIRDDPFLPSFPAKTTVGWPTLADSKKEAAKPKAKTKMLCFIYLLC